MRAHIVALLLASAVVHAHEQKHPGHKHHGHKHHSDKHHGHQHHGHQHHGHPHADGEVPAVRPSFDDALNSRIAALSPADRAAYQSMHARSLGLTESEGNLEAVSGSANAHIERAVEQGKGADKRQIRAQMGYVRTQPMYGLWPMSNAIARTPSSEIDHPVYGLQVGTVNNWDNGQIPKALRGIFYMEGNPYESECFSTGTGYMNHSTNTLDTPMWQPKTWSSDPGSGQIKSFVYYGSTFQTSCEKNSKGRLDCKSQQWNRRTNGIQYAGDYTAKEVSDNRWIRSSNIKGIVLTKNPLTYARYDYNMYRIVDENGKRTKYYQSAYLANIGRTRGALSNQWFVHLQEYQDVPQRA